MHHRTAVLTAAILIAGAISVPTAAHAQYLTLNQIDGLLTVANPSAVGYDSSLFGGWASTTGDDCDTRANLLTQQSHVAVTYSSDCIIATGEWTSWYDNQTLTDASEVEIDHLVPLAEAWASGASSWTSAQRSAFANDTDGTELQIVAASLLASKGDQDPSSWMPPNTSSECAYIADWVMTKYKWALSVDVSEQTAIAGYLAHNGCGDQAYSAPLIQIGDVAPPATDVTFPTVTAHPQCGVANAGISWSGAAGLTVAVLDSNYTAVADPNHLVPGEYFVQANLQHGFTLLDADVSAPWVSMSGEGVDVFSTVYPVTLAQTDTCVTTVALPTVTVNTPCGVGTGSVTIAGGVGVTSDVEDASYNAVDAGQLAPGTYQVIAVTNAGQFLSSLSLPAGWVAMTGEGDEIGAAGYTFTIAASAPCAVSQPVYRFYNPNNGTHFFTMDVNERNSLVLHSGLHYESVAYAAFSSQAPGTIPLYRFFFPNVSDHFYTTSAPERDSIRSTFPASAMSYEGIAYYIYPITPVVTDTVTVARFYSPDSGTHFFTANAAERDHIIQTFPAHSLTYEQNEFRVPAVIPADTNPPPVPPVVTLPVVTPPPATPPTSPGDTKNCSDFSTYAAAKAWFDLYYPYYGDVAKLDQDNDRIPCESLSGHP